MTEKIPNELQAKALHRLAESPDTLADFHPTTRAKLLKEKWAKVIRGQFTITENGRGALGRAELPAEGKAWAEGAEVIEPETEEIVLTEAAAIDLGILSPVGLAKREADIERLEALAVRGATMRIRFSDGAEHAGRVARIELLALVAEDGSRFALADLTDVYEYND